MQLFATGDSYTFGQELADSPDTSVCIDDEYRLYHSWPGVLARIMNFDDFTNAGLGGSGHDYAVRQTMRFTADWLAKGLDSKDLLVIVGWSHPSRREFYLDPGSTTEQDDQYFRFHQRYRRMPWLTGEQHDLMSLYRDHMMANPEGTTRALQHVVSLQSYLTLYGFPFMFFNSGWTLKPDSSLSNNLKLLIDTERYYHYDVPKCSFAGWMMNQNVGTKKPKGHPDEIAHAAWAGNLQNYIKEKNLLVPK